MTGSELPNRLWQPTAKRMRLGTRSCAECRRRKVRCIFEANSQVCRQCALHGASCIPQQPESLHYAQSSLQSQEYGDQKRLEKLENMIRQISSAIGINAESASVADFEQGTAKAFKQLQQRRSPEFYQDLKSGEGDSPHSSGLSKSMSPTPSTEANNSFERAPLLDLFKATMVIETDNTQPDIIQKETFTDQTVRNCIESLNAILPTNDVLFSIIQATEGFLPLWFPLSNQGDKSDTQHGCRIIEAINSIFEPFETENAISIARAVLHVAFCVQQLPASFPRHQDLPRPANILLDSYLKIVETLLSTDSCAWTVGGIECWSLISKIYLNMGKPRKTWLCCRRALDSSMILGLDSPRIQNDKHKRDLWASIWQINTHMALIIGVPCALPHPSQSFLEGSNNASTLQRISHKLGIACGHINERNHDPQSATYTTSQVEEELQECRDSMPPEWWDHGPTNLPWHELYKIMDVKMRYLELVKSTHLPFMLKPCVFGNQEHSKTAGLNAARDMIHSYQFFRRACAPTIIMCDVVDFLVFTGAIVLIIHLLGQSPHDMSTQDVSDWILVNDVRKSLDRVSHQLECSVAGQAAQLIEYLSSSYHGTYSGPEVYEAVIPYFGKIRIHQSKKLSSTASTVHSEPENSSALGLDTLEFSIGKATVDTWSDAEMGVDWTTVLDTDTTYDWNYVFNGEFT